MSLVTLRIELLTRRVGSVIVLDMVNSVCYCLDGVGAVFAIGRCRCDVSLACAGANGGKRRIAVRVFIVSYFGSVVCLS